MTWQTNYYINALVVVRSETSDEARNLAMKKCPLDIWENPELSSCNRLMEDGDTAIVEELIVR